ncbi:hypothetical protein [Afifella aestuarii]|nr:hypothetical protein [Afifella aestuarii]
MIKLDPTWRAARRVRITQTMLLTSATLLLVLQMATIVQQAGAS